MESGYIQKNINEVVNKLMQNGDIKLTATDILQLLQHGATREDISRLDTKIDNSTEKLEVKIDKLEAKFDKLEDKYDAKFDKIDEKFDKLEAKFDDKFDKLLEKIDNFTTMASETKSKLNWTIGILMACASGIIGTLAFAINIWISIK